MRRALLAAIVPAVCTAAILPMIGQAGAEATRVVVKGSGVMGTFGGRQYTWVTAEMQGTVARDDGTSGGYRAPITLVYPDRDPTGLGFVDVVNNADFSAYTDETAPYGKRSVGYTGAVIFSNFLFTEGYTYLSVQWSRMTTELLGSDYGVIENGLDGYEIIRDATRLLRSPEDLLAGLADGPVAVTRVIGHGQSQGAGVLRGMVWRGENREESGSLVFDGLLLTGHDGESCRMLNNDNTEQSDPGQPNVATFFKVEPCPDPLPDGTKVILLRTQTEPERAGRRLTRHELPSYRVYELAGVSHVPVFMRNLRTIGAARQNPASWEPVAKAMLRHLANWIVAGKEPPPPLYFEGVDEDGRFRLATDADGNVLGGIRLPHMPTTLPNGERAGAPLGVYGGVDPDLDPALGYGYARLGGTFKAFPADELAQRYPTREIYADLVRKAAAALLFGGYIVQEDHDAYIRSSERQFSSFNPHASDISE